MRRSTISEKKTANNSVAPIQRLTATERDRNGPNSVRAKAYRALLRSIDWALECGSKKWIDPEQRQRVWEEFRAAGVAWRFEGNAASSMVLIPHDLKSIKFLPSHFIATHSRSGYEATVQTLFKNGSLAVTERALDGIAYDRLAEVWPHGGGPEHC